MKISVTLTVEVDPAAWETIYGISGATAIRADVKQYIVEQVAGSAAAEEGGIKDVVAR